MVWLLSRVSPPKLNGRKAACKQRWSGAILPKDYCRTHWFVHYIFQPLGEDRVEYTGDILEKSDKINLKFLDNKNSFNEDEWSEIYNLSLKTYVEESDKSRERTAGAGLTDND